jgi:hypothetical protein
MRSFLSAMVLAASFALLVPDNGAQAVNAADVTGASVAPSSQAFSAEPAARDVQADRNAPIDTDAAILLSIGFLATVMARRLRAD